MGEQILEKVVGAPAAALDKTLTTSQEITTAISNKAELGKARSYWQTLGPGLTTGAADDDPSGVGTYSQAGAQYGLQLLWLASCTFPLMAVVQEMCARIGLVTGRGLAGNIRLYFPRWVIHLCTILLFAANTFNIGADLGAMAKAAQLLMPELNFTLAVVGFTVLSLTLQIFVPYAKYARYLKWLALILLSYVFAMVTIDLNWSNVLRHSFLPTFNFTRDKLMIITGVLGTTISPYLFFWQTSQEVEVQIMEGKTTIESRQEETSKSEVTSMRTDVWSGMFLSNLVMFAIIATCAAALNSVGVTNIQSAADAAMALKPIAGNEAYLLFTLGIVGTGLLAVPILAGSASYAISESFGWRYGLSRKLGEAYSFYGVIMISTLIGLAVNFIGLDPIKALIYSAVGNGLIAPVILVLIVLISRDRKVMGKWANGLLTNILGWLITGLMVVSGVATIISLMS